MYIYLHLESLVSGFSLQEDRMKVELAAIIKNIFLISVLSQVIHNLTIRVLALSYVVLVDVKENLAVTVLPLSDIAAVNVE